MTRLDIRLLADLEARGLIAQMTGENGLSEYLSEAPRTLYCGFDPTADSLHIGHLVPLLALKRFQDAGHKPIALVGGATGLIGDPSFKAQERQLNTPDVVAGWVERLRSQISRFVSFDCGDNSAEMANNLDWFGPMTALEFLRDVGKHFSVNSMIAKESVKQRIDREGSGISFTEFSYSLLQALDFAELHKRHGCSLQLGGSDQWGNITAGIDLTRRMHGGAVHGLTMPLVTKADGTKFGKTESGTIWLDPEKTSPYAFYQFWLGTADADVYKFLRYFTFLSVERIAEIEAEDAQAGGRPQAQRVLAEQMTALIHGDDGLAAAQRITEALFSGELADLSVADLEQLRLDGLPSAELSRGDLLERPLTQLLADVGMAAGKQVKDALGRNAVWVNTVAAGMDDNMKAAEVFAAEKALGDGYYVVRLGKKKYQLLVIR
ncbi:tyrosine--tRNA ligase [Spongiibacter sp. UBA1325]|jgi:tyrosyl-tRNA synthetase|uniref:tyrosine--tRNA ligase n=1 Tax=Spongiibacter sp. UBA1325 TaxID=1947543 RepID=UPI00257A1C26|nr:tyrosine--tRNA ligase [Spongiibacter sp. UBA1325]|tara:strand:+ start:1425 stop:2729 length:1305 start_codon:yes stop_codon:yes gene_type:complete